MRLAKKIKRKYKGPIQKKKVRFCCETPECKIYTEWHHIIPEYAGGTEDDDNLVELTRKEHATAHFLLWLQYHNEEDWIAWRGQEALIDQDEIFLEASSLGGKNAVKNKSGIHGLTKEERSANGKKAAEACRAKGSGFFGLTKEERSKYGKIGAAKTVAEGLGIHGATPEEKSKWCRQGHAVMYAKNKEAVDARLKAAKEKLHQCPKCDGMYNTPNIDLHIKTCKVDPSHYWATNLEIDILVPIGGPLPEGFQRGKRCLRAHAIKKSCPKCGAKIGLHNLSRHIGKEACMKQQFLNMFS